MGPELGSNDGAELMEGPWDGLRLGPLDRLGFVEGWLVGQSDVDGWTDGCPEGYVDSDGARLS